MLGHWIAALPGRFDLDKGNYRQAFDVAYARLENFTDCQGILWRVGDPKHSQSCEDVWGRTERCVGRPILLTQA